ncbi:MAG: hypothetical protein JSW17_04375 [Candidatus Omnitrophota bacterium]|nr:MAG: hypothetical protein JSW17_04375 [Candidatus Omnitrophota bacterium]
MRSKIIVAIIIGLFIAVSGAMLLSVAQGKPSLRRIDVARAVADTICLEIVPGLATFAPDEQYEVLANALAFRGITNFIGTDPEDVITVGEMQEIYDIIAAGEVLEFAGDRVRCPTELVEVFSAPWDTELVRADLQTILRCFPDCDPTAEAYTPPEEGFEPGPPQPLGEEFPPDEGPLS